MVLTTSSVRRLYLNAVWGNRRLAQFKTLLRVSPADSKQLTIPSSTKAKVRSASAASRRRIVQGRGHRNEHQQRRCKARSALPSLEEVGEGQNREARNGDPAQPRRRRGAVS